MRFKMKGDNRGLTLLELLVGVAILAIIVTPLLHTFITGANAARKNKIYSDANQAAQNIIEDIEANDMANYLKDNELSLIEDENDPNYGKYFKVQKNVLNNDSKLDARITIEEADSATIPFSNQMDARFDMQEVDATAYKMFKSSVYEDEQEEGSTEYDFSKLSRYITIDVDYVTEDDPTTCKVKITFDYYGTVKKIFTDSEGKPHYENIDFSYPVVSKMNVTQRSDETFAVFLFFKAYDISDGFFDMRKTEINNNTKNDFNVFLVDVSNHSFDGGTNYDVEYKPKFKDIKAKLLTNMENVTYKVYKRADSIWHTPEEVGATLVETDSISREYNITVEVYNDNDLLLTMETSKLDYSIQD